MKSYLLTPLALLALIPAALFAQEQMTDHSEHIGMSMEGSSGSSGSSSGGSPAQSNDAYAPSRMEMHKNMDVKPSGNPDLDFVNNMIPHHEGALAMAKVELENGKNPDLRRLAKNIIRTQEKEIAMMKRYQANHQK